jgi:SHS family lactate transporter-like MFS transporter
MLTFRPLGALIFGLLSDKYGRKYPLMANIFIFSGLQLASGFAPNFLTYSITRAIFGIAMGGEWGLGAALAMEVLPLESRGYLFMKKKNFFFFLFSIVKIKSGRKFS